LAVSEGSATSVHQQKHSSRRRHRRRGWRVAFFALAAVSVIGAAAWVLFSSPLLVVRSVTVSGTHLVPRSEVLASSGVQLGTPLIRVNTARAAARIAQIRQVRSVRITRSWPDRLVIVVRERTPELGVTAPGGGYDLVDGDGVMVRWAARSPAGLPLYDTEAPAGALRGDPDLAAAAAVLGELPAAVRHVVDGLEPGDAVDVGVSSILEIGGRDAAGGQVHGEFACEFTGSVSGCNGC